MTRFILFILLFACINVNAQFSLNVGVFEAANSEPMVLTVNTTLGTGTADFTLQCRDVGTYNAVFDWDDGSTSEITSYNDADLAHTYSSGGTYDITITGTLPAIYFNNSGDRLKLTAVIYSDLNNDVDQLGAFYGCGNVTSLTFTTSGLEFINNTMTHSRQMFRSFGDASFPSGITFATTTDIREMFLGVSGLSLPEGVTFESALLCSSAIRSCGSIVIPSTMKLESMTDGSLIMSATTATTASYSQLLVNMNANNTNTGVTFFGGSSKYNTTGETARNALTSRVPPWVITDGGLE